MTILTWLDGDLSGRTWDFFDDTPWVGTFTPVVANGALIIELAFGADLAASPSTWAWTDVTDDSLVHEGGSISWSIGQHDESGVSAPANATIELDNRQNRYSAYNPFCSNYPNVVRGTPGRVRLSSDSGSTFFTKFQGYADGFTPTVDQTGTYVTSTVSISGILRRLQQNTKPLRSALYRKIMNSSPLAYWTFEDGSESTQGASAVPGQRPMTAQFPSVYLPKFADVTGVNGSAALPDWGGSGGANMFAPVSGGTAGAGGWTVDIAFFSGTKANADDVYVSTIQSATGELFAFGPFTSTSIWKVIHNNGVGTITTLFSTAFSSSVNPYDGKAHMIRLQARQSGADVAVTLTIDDTYTSTATLAAHTLQPVSIATVGTAGLSGSVPVGLGHLGVWNGTSVPNHTTQMNGNVGETPEDRMTRLCAEEGVGFTIVGFHYPSVTMGPQGVDTFINLLRECELADSGSLYDGTGAGLFYQQIAQRFYQTTALTLSATASEFMVPFTPIDDDQRTKNLVVAERKNGSNDTFEQVPGPLGTGTIGVYDASVTVNHEDDHQLYDRASWDVHSGTITGFRYPSLELDFAARPSVANNWLHRSDGGTGPVVPGSRLDVTNVSSWVSQMPPETVDLVLIGWTEEINHHQWKGHLNCIPGQIYDVFIVEDVNLGRIQTDGSTLAAGVLAGATSLSVATPTGSRIWTTTAIYPADFPFYVEISGIKVTVTAITGTSSPQTFTVTGVTKDLPNGSTVVVWHPGVIRV